MSRLLFKKTPDSGGNPEGSLPYVNQNLAPPAPPPLQPVTHVNNPYEFITQGTPQSKRTLLPGGGSKKMRIILVVAGVLVLAIMASIVMGIISNGNTGLREDYQSLVEQQVELMRVSAIGQEKAQQAEAKNLAITTTYSLTSEQPALLALAKKTGASTDAKHLALGANSQTDKLLTSAEQNNEFDRVFISTMQTNLKKFQQTVKKIHDETTSKIAKDILSDDYANASILIGKAAPGNN